MNKNFEKLIAVRRLRRLVRCVPFQGVSFGFNYQELAQARSNFLPDT